MLVTTRIHSQTIQHSQQKPQQTNNKTCLEIPLHQSTYYLIHVLVIPTRTPYMRRSLQASVFYIALISVGISAFRPNSFPPEFNFFEKPPLRAFCFSLQIVGCIVFSLKCTSMPRLFNKWTVAISFSPV